jgi:hypothetical protein
MKTYYDKLKELLTPYDLGFTKMRIGPPSDGGYVIYQEPLSKTNSVYSLGIGPVCGSDFQLAQMGKIIHMYDSGPFYHNDHSNYRFKQTYVTSEVFDAELDLVNNNDLLLCMDIDGSEYEVIPNMKEENLLKFSQISIEIHWIGGKNRIVEGVPNNGERPLNDNGKPIIETMERLNKYFYLYHIHINNGANAFENFPDVIECSYLRKDLCVQVEKETKAYPLDGLDYPNYTSPHNLAVNPEFNWWI